jgi:hypothetical protein
MLIGICDASLVRGRHTGEPEANLKIDDRYLSANLGPGGIAGSRQITIVNTIPEGLCTEPRDYSCITL